MGSVLVDLPLARLDLEQGRGGDGLPGVALLDEALGARRELVEAALPQELTEPRHALAPPDVGEVLLRRIPDHPFEVPVRAAREHPAVPRDDHALPGLRAPRPGHRPPAAPRG